MSLHIAVLMMVKNEKKRFHVTLESIKDFAGSLILYDTGSVDDTIEIAREFCEKNNIIFRLKQGEFVNFAISRNVALDFADTFEDVDYLLLMDCNDELRGGDNLKKYALEFKNIASSSFLLCQQWWSGAKDSYYNTRFIKPRHKWRYVGSVHEYIKSTPEIEKAPTVKLPDDTYLYQDRTQDDDKTGKRFIRDKELLLIDYEKDPKNTRTVFYLAQTCSCLNQFEDSFKYYDERSKLEGFGEEVFQSLLKTGEIAQKLGKDWHTECLPRYIKAFEKIARAEPLCKLAEYYNTKKNFNTSYMFIKMACDLKYPDDCILFVDKLSYDYRRWHLMGICAYYIKKFEDGHKACLTAIENGQKHNINVDIDRSNLKFYEDVRDQSTANDVTVKEILTKKDFISKKIKEMNETNPGLTEKQKHSRALLAWKSERK
jgi:glycosyltransferase involved in cell wall biosynthesis